VKTADEDGDIKKPDGFYVQYLEASGQRPAGYILAFTHTGSGDLDDTTEVARRISAQHQLFIPAGLPLEKAVAARLVVRTTPGFQVPSYDDILIAARILHLVQNGTKRDICGRDKGYIPVPIGRNGEAGARWLADASPISTYFPLSRKVVSLSDERPVIRNLRRDTILIEDRPNETTLTVFVLEDIDGSWKRVRRGDWRGTNGNARFSHLAGSKCRLVVAAAYMTGRKVSGIKSLRPKYAVFDAHGSLTPALFGDSMREYLDFDRKPEDPLPEWEIMEREIVEITELILTSRRSDDLLPR
jgi:hypothetical protein